MAEPSTHNEAPLGNTDAKSENAQQALDDLTVQNNVENQSLGDARLNVVRSADVSDTQLGNLANVQQGSTGNPQVQNLGGVSGGINPGLDVAIDNAKDSAISPPELDSTPLGVNLDGATVSVNAGGAAPLNVRELPDLAKPDAEFKPEDHSLGQPVSFAPPTGGTPGNAPQSAQPANAEATADKAP
ncbi:MAG: hypothetical protein HY055_05070, partial [Magnetospirillum sp.]|nr:hypothetical protein [Magnetospirillum sp.]